MYRAGRARRSVRKRSAGINVAERTSHKMAVFDKEIINYWFHKQQVQASSSFLVLRHDSLLDQQLLQLPVLVHVVKDVRTTNKFAVDVDLRDRGPVGVLFDPAAKLLVGEHIERFELFRHVHALERQS